MSQAAFQAIVSGRVQVVLYRDFAKRNAQALSIVGEVMNLPDGTVRVVAEGPKDALREFAARLQKGPMLADVVDVAIEWREPSAQFKGFSIHY